MPTVNTPIKFTDADKALIADLKARLGYKSTAETVRHALRIAEMVAKAETVSILVKRKKSRKGG